MDIVTMTLVLFPNMFQVWACDEYQVNVADDFAVIANHAAGSCCVLQKVQLHHIVTVYGVVEFFFVTVCHIHEILFSQRCNLVKHYCFHIVFMFLF